MSKKGKIRAALGGLLALTLVVTCDKLLML